MKKQNIYVIFEYTCARNFPILAHLCFVFMNIRCWWNSPLNIVIALNFLVLICILKYLILLRIWHVMTSLSTFRGRSGSVCKVCNLRMSFLYLIAIYNSIIIIGIWTTRLALLHLLIMVSLVIVVFLIVTLVPHDKGRWRKLEIIAHLPV